MEKLTAEQIARVCHEANRAYCVTQGDTSQVPWDEAPQWQRDSCSNGVAVALADPNATPESQHANWRKHKVDDGWKFGPVKDPAKKEHPCMVPYADLPAAQRRKDSLFLATVRALQGG